MKLAPLIAGSLALAAVPAAAQTPSQHPRIGQLAKLHFALGSSRLPPGDQLTPLLGSVAAWAMDNPDGLVVLDGHADPSGPSALNVRLSLRRAQAVRDQLVALGVDAEHIVIAAYGEDVPTHQGPAEDRRVVVWGTRSGMRAVIARTMARGRAVIETGGQGVIATR